MPTIYPNKVASFSRRRFPRLPRVSGIITGSPELYSAPVITDPVGVHDRFDEAAAPRELIKEFEVSTEHI